MSIFWWIRGLIKFQGEKLKESEKSGCYVQIEGSYPVHLDVYGSMLRVEAENLSNDILKRLETIF